MPLSPGTRLGVYEVTGSLGAGGMGEVYRARDTTLDRDVALKVLPEAFTADPDRAARFEREAKVLASLNHPNIGGIHGLEEAPSTRSAGSGSTPSGAEGSTSSGQGGIKALVLELIEGPTLADRIAKGPIPVDEALPIAGQIAEALEAAHDAGVIHRDLKPANIKVRDDGTVKVLDFGLAKAFQPDAGDPNLSLSPTISLTAAATQMGMVIGTAAYMAPEQAKGKVVDKRADIWAFGAVLYEMLTGTRVFSGEDVTDTIAAVVRAEPDWTALPADVPARVGQVVRACLQKSLSERPRDIGDVSLAMRGTFETTLDSRPDPVEAPPLRSWQRPSTALATLALAVLLTGLAVWGLTRPTEAPGDVVRFTITPPDTEPLHLPGANHELAISPDGTQIVYQGLDAAGQLQLFLRPTDQLSGGPVRGTTDGAGPFFSPDGQWIGFMPGPRTLQRVSVIGGTPVTVTEAPHDIHSASWTPDDQIVFGTIGAGLFRVSGGGGEAEALTTPDAEQGGTSHVQPFVIPDHDAVVFVIGGDVGGQLLTEAQLAVLDLTTGDVAHLGLAGASPRYVSTGHLVYAVEDGSIRAVPFDAAAREVTGAPVPLVEGVVVKGSGAANFSISDNGRLIYVVGTRDARTERGLAWVDRQGVEPIAVAQHPYLSLSVSPDGARAAVQFADETGNTDVWVSELARGTLTRLTTHDAFDGNPLWSPDGRSIVFASDRNGEEELFRQAADGSGAAELLLSLDDPVSNLIPYGWSPDGATLLLQAMFRDTGRDLGMMSVDGPGAWEPLLQTAAEEWAPALSPDGRWLAYSSTETGRNEVYVQRFPEMTGRRPISAGGGHRPAWSADGRQLFYQETPSGGTPVAVTSVRLDILDTDEADPTTIDVGPSERLFAWGPYVAEGGGRRYQDLWADGERFLTITTGGDTTVTDSDNAPDITVVLNWFEELKARVPVP